MTLTLPRHQLPDAVSRTWDLWRAHLLIDSMAKRNAARQERRHVERDSAINRQNQLGLASQRRRLPRI